MTHDEMNEPEPLALPKECVTITPAKDGLTVAYQMAPDGTDLAVLVITDERVGTMRALFTVEAACYIVGTLAAVLDNLDTMRAEWRNSGLGT